MWLGVAKLEHLNVASSAQPSMQANLPECGLELPSGKYYFELSTNRKDKPISSNVPCCVTTLMQVAGLVQMLQYMHDSSRQPNNLGSWRTLVFSPFE